MRTAREQAAYLDGMERGIRSRRKRSEDECMALVDFLYRISSDEVKRELDFPNNPTARPWLERRAKSK